MLSLRYWIVRIRGWLEGIPFSRALRDPKQHQLLLLQKILKDNAQTPFGQDHDFDYSLMFKPFKSVPICNYQQHKPISIKHWGNAQASPQTHPLCLRLPVGPRTSPSGSPSTILYQ